MGKGCKQKIHKRRTPTQSIPNMPMKITGTCLPPAPSFLKYMIPNTGQGIMKEALSYIIGGRT